MKILFLDTAHPVLIEALRADGHECIENYQCSAEDLKGTGINGIVIRSRFRLDRELMERFPDLRFIARVGSGMENIDLNHAGSKGIKCLHAPEGNRSAVAEHALGMLLMLMNNLKKADTEVRELKWLREENRGHEIEGKTIGIIGFGNMGSALAERLAGFNCTILVHDKYKNAGDIKRICKSSGVTAVAPDMIFHEADIVSLHLPLTEETHYYADELFFNSFVKPVYFINTARGKNVKTNALVQAIRSGKVKGACLDVLEYESGSFENAALQENADFRYLAGSDRVILTPHIAGWSHESNLKMANILLGKIRNISSL